RRAELELNLRNAVGIALMTIKGPASLVAEQSSARAMELCQRPGINFEQISLAFRGAYFAHLSRPDVRKAGETAVELLALAEEHGSADRIAATLNWLGLARLLSGEFELAAQDLDRAWALLESMAKPAISLPQLRAGGMPKTPTIELTSRVESQAFNRIYSAWNLWFLGYPDRALDQISIATAIAHDSGSKVVQVVVHDYATNVYELRRELDHTRERAEATLALSAELGNVIRRVMSEILLGWADAMAGDLDGGIARMRQYMLVLKAAGSEIRADYNLARIATALGRIGRFDEGLRTIGESFPFIERSGQRSYEAEVHRLKGELLLAQDGSNAAQAEHSLRTAIDISRKQHAKSWELRATTSLARLLLQQGKCDEARAMLAEIYNWFTEGFDTADLKDAKALLDELNA
ncbi:MAG TPA: hypothetical protein VNF27_09035, partial [Candidatus Binataceae bacterium]|nr:hypothetical protein [Candidatus Binataceae bacterium]